MARRGMLSRSCHPTNPSQHHGHSTTSSLRVTIAAGCGCVARVERWPGSEGAKGFFLSIDFSTAFFLVALLR
jgi:hypothetical protein